jgi:hypothetical protein
MNLGSFLHKRVSRLDDMTELGMLSAISSDIELGASSMQRRAPPRGGTTEAVAAHWSMTDGGPRGACVKRVLCVLGCCGLGCPPLYSDSLGDWLVIQLGGAGGNPIRGAL